VCEAFPITDLSSLQLYATNNCTVVVGDLYISNLESSIIRAVLFSNLQGIRSIRGSLYFDNNPYLTAMTFFSKLESVTSVRYLNNPRLVDARMPSLTSLPGSLSVTGCDRLCTARYTAVGAGPDDSGCPDVSLYYYLHVDGLMQVSDVATIVAVMDRTLRNVTQNQVGMCFMIEIVV
jgi:hypothetical protein